MKLTYAKLYSKTWNNKIMQWQLFIIIKDGYIQIEKVHNYIDSDKPIVTSEIKLGNFKVNDCNLLAQKLVQSKRNSGYRTLVDLDCNINNINDDFTLNIFLKNTLTSNKFDKNDIAKPMKAKPFKSGMMQYPAYLQPKINGVRCVISKIKKDEGLFGKSIDVSIKSREGIEYDVPHVKEEAKRLFQNLSEDVVLDGELYHHGSPAPTIAGASRNIANPVNKKLVYLCFDLAIPTLSQEERFVYMDSIPFDQNSSIKQLNTIFINSDEEAIEVSTKLIEEGYEGGIIRDITSPYYFGGRRSNMLKVKKFITSEFIIIDVIGWDKNPEIGVFVCKNDITGDLFNCNIMATIEQRKNYLTNKYNVIGRKALIKFYERTINKIPFHANIVRIL